MKTCTYEECEGKHHARELCQNHYRQWCRRYLGLTHTYKEMICIGCGKSSEMDREFIKSRSECKACCRQMWKTGSYERKHKHRPQSLNIDDLIQLFFDECTINQETGCWESSRSRNNAYPRISLNGKPQLLHRIVNEYHYGSLGSLHSLHHCDNPTCIKPTHLFRGTHQNNMQDMVNKGRQGDHDNKGEKNGRAQVNEYQVRFIRKYNSAHGDCPMYLYKELAKMFGVGKSTIRNIVSENSWRGV